MRQQKSCANCYRRKQKCDLNKPCSRCIKLEVACIYGQVPDSTVLESKGLITDRDIKRLDKKFQELEKKVEGVKATLLSPTNNFTSSKSGFPTPNSDTQSISPKTITDKEINEDILKQEGDLIDTFISYNRFAFPIFSDKKLKGIYGSLDYRDRALTTAMCAFSTNAYNYLNDLPLVTIEQNIYYKNARSLITRITDHNMKSLVAILICLQMEMGNGRPVKASFLSAESIRVGHMLGLQNLDLERMPYELDEEGIEARKIWLQCLTLDMLTSFFFSNPTSIRRKPYITACSSFIMKNLEEAGTRVYTKLEKEYLMVHVFHYLVNIKVQIITSNIKSKESGSNYEEVKLGLLKSLNILKFHSFFELFDNNEPNFFIDSNQVPRIAPSFTLKTFKESLSMISNYLLSRILGQGNEEDIIQSLKYKSQAKTILIGLFEIFTEGEKFYESIYPGKGNLVYALHFSHGFIAEWALMLCTDDNGLAEQKFVNRCKMMQSHFASFWPIFKSKEAKRHIIRVQSGGLISSFPDFPNFN